MMLSMLFTTWTVSAQVNNDEIDIEGKINPVPATTEEAEPLAVPEDNERTFREAVKWDTWEY